MVILQDHAILATPISPGLYLRRLSPVVLRRDVALGRAHVDARLVHAPVAELHLERLTTATNGHGGGGDGGGGRGGGIKTVTQLSHLCATRLFG